MVINRWDRTPGLVRYSHQSRPRLADTRAPRAPQVVPQNQLMDPVGMAQGDLLGDHAAHGNAENVGAGNVQGVQEPHGVGGHQGNRETTPSRVGSTGPAIVNEDHLVAGRQRIHQPGRPPVAVRGISDDHHQGLAGSLDPVVHVDITDAGFWHGSFVLSSYSKTYVPGASHLAWWSLFPSFLGAFFMSPERSAIHSAQCSHQEPFPFTAPAFHSSGSSPIGSELM